MYPYYFFLEFIGISGHARPMKCTAFRNLSYNKYFIIARNTTIFTVVLHFINNNASVGSLRCKKM